MGRLNGKTALVVGAAGKDNMAQVIARRLTAEGARVAVAGRKADALSAFADEIGDAAKSWAMLLTTSRRRSIGTMACSCRRQVPSNLSKL